MAPPLTHRFFWRLLWCSLFLATATLHAGLHLERLSLQEAEAIALEWNKSLLIAKEGTEQAHERKLQAISRYLPSISYTARFQETAQKELFFDVFRERQPFSHQGYGSMLEMRQPFISTNLIYGLKARKLEEKAFRFEQANTKNELLLALRKSYYAVILFERALEIERENIDYLAYALQQEQGKLEAGNATPFEVNQSKVALANAITKYYNTLKDLKNSRNALILTLGIDPLLEPQMKLTEEEAPLFAIPEISIKLQQLEKEKRYELSTFPTVDDFLSHIDRIEEAKELILFKPLEVRAYLEIALERRPDLQRLKLEIGVAEETVKQKQGTYFPELSAYARYSYNDVFLGVDPYFNQPYHLSGGLVLSWNLFDSLLREHEIQEAKSVKSASNLRFQELLQRIEVEIRNGLYQLEEALLGYLSSTQSVYLAEQASLQAKEKLEAGKIAPLEYRDSVNLLAQARNQQNRASFDLIAAYYELRYATGLDS